MSRSNIQLSACLQAHKKTLGYNAQPGGRTALTGSVISSLKDVLYLKWHNEFWEQSFPVRYKSGKVGTEELH